jgi:glycerol-3-phosphate dehydrogenase subunit C
LRLAIGLRNRSHLLAKAAERLFGIAADIPLPQLSKQPFAPPPLVQNAPRGDVILFADTFATHFEPDIASAAIEVLTAAGYSVTIAKPAADDQEPRRPLCCGRT